MEHKGAKNSAEQPTRRCKKVSVGLSIPDDDSIIALFTYNSVQNEADSVQSQVRRELPGAAAHHRWSHLHDVTLVSSVLAHVTTAAHSERDAWAELEATAAHKAKRADQAAQKLPTTTTIRRLGNVSEILRTSMSSVGDFFERRISAFRESSHRLLPTHGTSPLKGEASTALMHSMAHYRGRMSSSPTRGTEPSPPAALTKSNAAPPQRASDADERKTQEQPRFLQRGSTPPIALKFEADADAAAADGLQEPSKTIEPRSLNISLRAAFLPICACMSPRGHA